MSAPMTHTHRTWSIELLLLEDGSVSIRADDGKVRSHALRRVEQTPAGALRAVDEWLEPHEDGSITVVVRSPQAPIAVWTSCCASLLLYRMASVLGNDDWTPDFEHSDPPAEAAPDDTASTGIRMRVALPKAASS
jgi:hypothetical protein